MRFVVKQSFAQLEADTDRKKASSVTDPRPEPTELRDPSGTRDPIFDGLAPAWFTKEADESEYIASRMIFTDCVTRELRRLYLYQRAYAEGRIGRYPMGNLRRPDADVFRRFAAMCEGLAVDFEQQTLVLLENPSDIASMNPRALEFRRRMIDATVKRADSGRRRRRQILRDIKQTEGKGWRTD